MRWGWAWWYLKALVLVHKRVFSKSDRKVYGVLFDKWLYDSLCRHSLLKCWDKSPREPRARIPDSHIRLRRGDSPLLGLSYAMPIVLEFRCHASLHFGMIQRGSIGLFPTFADVGVYFPTVPRTIIWWYDKFRRFYPNPFGHPFVRHLSIYLVAMMIPNLSPRRGVSIVAKVCHNPTGCT